MPKFFTYVSQTSEIFALEIPALDVKFSPGVIPSWNFSYYRSNQGYNWFSCQSLAQLGMKLQTNTCNQDIRSTVSVNVIFSAVPFASFIDRVMEDCYNCLPFDISYRLLRKSERYEFNSGFNYLWSLPNYITSGKTVLKLLLALNRNSGFKKGEEIGLTLTNNNQL